MIKTISLLEEKNMYLEKFLGLNRDRLDCLGKGDFTELQRFREDREMILNIIKHIDSLIEARTAHMDEAEIEQNAKVKVSRLMERKDSLVKAILSQDIDIMSIIEKAKSEIIMELRKVRGARKTIGSYKSQSRKDNIDEEA